MTAPTDTPDRADKRYLPMPEFVTMLALLFALLAFSIDAMLPAFPEIVATMTPDQPNRVQLILTAFVVGMGLGTIVVGPLSDAFGRLPVITFGIGIFIIGATLAWKAPTLDWLLAARFLQGLGAAAPRIVPLALLRDLYSGRRMAQISSYMMTVFMLAPAVAPFVGQAIIRAFDWQAIFLMFTIVAAIGVLWINLRQPETLPPESRRRFVPAQLLAGTRECLSNRLVVIYIAALTLGYTQLFATISTTQQIYDQVFGLAESFPIWFMATAVVAGSGTVLNGMLVMRFGMRRLAQDMFTAQLVISTLVLGAWYLDVIPEAAEFWVWFGWSVSLFFSAGLTFGNLNALALQPLGHIAGLAASIIGAISTIVSAALAALISLSFQGTPVPVFVGSVLCCLGAVILIRLTRDEEPAAP